MFSSSLLTNINTSPTPPLPKKLSNSNKTPETSAAFCEQMLNKLRTTVLQIKGQRHQGVTQLGHLSCLVKVKLNRFYCSLVNLGNLGTFFLV